MTSPRPERSSLAIALLFGVFSIGACTTSSGSRADSSVVQSGRGSDTGWHAVTQHILTRWASDVSPSKVLPEYPRPQMVRPRWESLNGLWEFGAITDTTGALPSTNALTDHILVPFAMESALSGVGRHAERVAYRRTFRVPSSMQSGEHLLLHFDAVDWRTTVWLNGKKLGEHSGGYDPFAFDITDALKPSGDQELVVSVYDPTDTFGQPRGKQVSKPQSIWYTPVTGIWQTVWLEPVPASSIDRLRMTPDVDASVLRLTVSPRGANVNTLRVSAVARSNGQTVGQVQGAAGAELRLSIPKPHLWSPDDPFLYDLAVSLLDGTRVVDSVTSYFGMRKIGLAKDANGFLRIALNGSPVFQIGPLDQGWWPDGLYTAPTDEALASDIRMMKALGFNMVRKHIKVEPPRWYYYADKLGLAVWQDMPSGWNDSPEARKAFESELRAMIENRRNSPSIVVWVPFNEKWGQFDTKRIVGIIKSMDPSRLVNDASGWQHEGAGDIIDVHRYQGPQAMRGAEGRAAVVGEFGGLGLKVDKHTWAPEGWGYSGLFDNRQALADRYDLLLKRLYHDRDTHGIGAGVYTQLTDVEVELNGFMTYDRADVKFDTARVAAANRGWAPYVLPEYPEFTDSVRVTIHQGTPTEVHYTVDGSEPTASSPKYTAPFVVTQNTTVRARSFANGRPTAAAEARTEYKKTPGREAVTASVVPGLQYAYFADTTKEFPFRMNWPVRERVEHPDNRPNDLKPKKSGMATDFSLAARDTNDMFAFRWAGYVKVPRTGVYTFTAVADDGAALWVGDRFVFGSVGQSPKTTETWGQIALQAGLHPIVVGYFQAYGPMGMELSVEGPGMARQRVPASMFFRDAAGSSSGTAP